MANRHLLAVNKLEEFKNWLIENDWKIERTKGKYEVLRARKSTEKLPLIVYKKDKDGLIHLSVSDWNTKYVADFINSKKDNKSNNLQQQLDHQKAMWNALKEWVKNKSIEIKRVNAINEEMAKIKDYIDMTYRECYIKIQELEQGEKDVKD